MLCTPSLRVKVPLVVMRVLVPDATALPMAVRRSYGPGWQRLAFIPPPPPPRAASVRLVAVASEGPAWFDDFDLLLLHAYQVYP